MSLRLPTADSPTRQLFDVAHLAAMVQARALPTFREALTVARGHFTREAGFSLKAKAIHCFCMRADGEIWLLRVGPRGGWSKVWNFGDNA